MAEVKALRGWSGGRYGDRAKGDRFDYDVAKDPDDLVKLGLVAPVKGETDKKAGGAG